MRIFPLAALAWVSPSRSLSLFGRELLVWWRGSVTRGEQPHPPDWMPMFQPGAPWQQGMSHLTVFKVAAQFVLHGADEQIHTVVDGLHRNHVAFAVG